MADVNANQTEQDRQVDKPNGGQTGAKVTREAVFAAADAITEGGQTATVERIRTYLGGGSPNDVLKYQRDWKAERASRGAQEAPKADKVEEKRPASQRVISLQDVPDVAEAIEQIRNAVGGVELAILSAVVGVQQRGEDAAATQVRALQESHARTVAQLRAEMQQVRDAAQASIAKAEAEKDDEVAGFGRMMTEAESAANNRVLAAETEMAQARALLEKVEAERKRLEGGLTEAAAKVQQLETEVIPELKQELTAAIAGGATLKAERDGLQQELGAVKAEAGKIPDLTGERDRLRQQLHDLQVSSTEKVTEALGKVETGKTLVEELRADRDRARDRADKLDRRMVALENALMAYPNGIAALRDIPPVEDAGTQPQREDPQKREAGDASTQL